MSSRREAHATAAPPCHHLGTDSALCRKTSFTVLVSPYQCSLHHRSPLVTHDSPLKPATRSLRIPQNNYFTLPGAIRGSFSANSNSLTHLQDAVGETDMGALTRICDVITVFDGKAERTGQSLNLRGHLGPRYCSSILKLITAFRMHGDGEFYLARGEWPEELDHIDLTTSFYAARRRTQRAAAAAAAAKLEA